MSERRKRSWIAWGILVPLLVLTVYPLSFGPVVSAYFRLSDAVPGIRETNAGRTMWAFYRPVDRAFEIAPLSFQRIYSAYFKWWTGESMIERIETIKLFRRLRREAP